MDGYRWQGQLLFNEDGDDAFYVLVTWLNTIDITAAEDRDIDCIWCRTFYVQDIQFLVTLWLKLSICGVFESCLSCPVKCTHLLQYLSFNVLILEWYFYSFLFHISCQTFITALTWTVWVVECWSVSSPASSWSCFALLTQCWPSVSWCSCGLWGTPCLQEGQGWRNDCLFSPGSWEYEGHRSSFRAWSCWGALWRLDALK